MWNWQLQLFVSLYGDQYAQTRMDKIDLTVVSTQLWVGWDWKKLVNNNNNLECIFLFFFVAYLIIYDSRFLEGKLVKNQ